MQTRFIIYLFNIILLVHHIFIKTYIALNGIYYSILEGYYANYNLREQCCALQQINTNT